MSRGWQQYLPAAGDNQRYAHDEQKPPSGSRDHHSDELIRYGKDRASLSNSDVVVNTNVNIPTGLMQRD